MFNTISRSIFAHVETIKLRAAKLRGDKSGVTALEYGLLAGVVVATIAVGFASLATSLSGKFDNIGTSL